MCRYLRICADIDLVRQQTRGVQIRFPDNLWESLPAILQREVPAATDQLPGIPGQTPANNETLEIGQPAAHRPSDTPLPALVREESNRPAVFLEHAHLHIVSHGRNGLRILRVEQGAGEGIIGSLQRAPPTHMLRI